MRGTPITLASNAGAATGTAAYWYGGAGAFTGEGTFGGGSAKLQFKTQNGTWIDYPSGSLSANGIISFTLPPCEIRAVTATGSGFYCYALYI